MQDDLVDKQKFNIGYIYHRAKGEYLIMLANSKVQPGSRNRVRLMKDQIHCGLASYRIYENSPLTPYVNVFLRRFSENGLYEKQLEWMQNLNQAVFQVKQNERNKREVVVLTGNMISGVFFIYLVGIGTATFSFGIEITFGFFYPLIFHKSISRWLLNCRCFQSSGYMSACNDELITLSDMLISPLDMRINFSTDIKYEARLNSRFDVQLTSFPHQGRNFTKRILLSTTESLYPHDIDCITAIVPEQAISNRFLRKTLEYADTQAICIALLLFLILRFFLHKAAWRQGFTILFKTVGVFLNQSNIENDDKIKVAWDMNLRAFSLLATTTLSAIIFKNMVATERNEINTVDHLIESNLTIYAPDYLQYQDTWVHMKSSLRSKIEFKTANDMQDDLVDKQKFNFAYIYHRAKGEYLIMLANSKVQAGSRTRVRLMKNQIHCGLASYRIYENSPLTPYVNNFLLRFLENGIYEKQLEWMQDLNQAVFQVKQKEPTQRDAVVLTVDMIYGCFLMYLVGIGTATISFVMEITFGFLYPLIISQANITLIEKVED